MPHIIPRGVRILTQAMQSIPESKIDIKSKVTLCKEIDYTLACCIHDYSYNESLHPLLHQRFSGNISAKAYKAAIQAVPLDYSEYIMLTLGLLQGILSSPQDFIDLNQVRQLYLQVEYEKAIQKITNLAMQHQGLLGEVYPLTVLSQKKLVEVEIYKNYTRRFFENRLSQLYFSGDLGVPSIHKISQYLIGSNTLRPEQIERSILGLADHVDQETTDRFRQIVKQSDLFKLHDRMDKLGFADKAMESLGIVGEKVYTRNRGVMTSNMPNFYDELSLWEMKNRVVDTTSTCEDITLYSFSRPRAVFVASLSGHTFLMVALLEKYMLAHANDPDLQTDICYYIKAIIAVYLSHGYHSYVEITDVFKDPVVQKVFSAFNVELDFMWTDALVQAASSDAQEYTKSLCLKRAMQFSLAGATLFSRARHEDVPKNQPLAFSVAFGRSYND